ncbi:MAG: hypothetical protein ABJA18_09495 [bacterium]
MYCSTCGVAVAQGLSYCKNCGAALGEAKTGNVVKSSEVKPELLVQSMAAVFVFGLGAITIFMGVMKTALQLDIGQVLAFTMLSFLIMLLIEGVFVYLLLGRKRGDKEVSATRLPKERATNELDAAQVRELPEPLSSVTEQTTRTLAPVPTERK